MAVITISRGTVSGGQAVAEYVAKRLGYQCLSRELIVDAAMEFGVPVQLLTSTLEEPTVSWQRLTAERSGYHHYIRAALCERALQDNIVYHSYAGHLLLSGVSHVLRVRVIAPLDRRIIACMDRMRLGRKEATAHIKQVDRQRAKWTRFIYSVDWADPSLYDVVVNLERMTVAEAGEVVVGMSRMECFQSTPESDKALRDLAQGSRVWAALRKDPRTAAADLTVSADGDTVTVSGLAASYDAASSIPEVAGQVPGVERVNCEVGYQLVYD